MIYKQRHYQGQPDSESSGFEEIEHEFMYDNAIWQTGTALKNTYRVLTKLKNDMTTSFPDMLPYPGTITPSEYDIDRNMGFKQSGRRSAKKTDWSGNFYEALAGAFKKFLAFNPDLAKARRTPAAHHKIPHAVHHPELTSAESETLIENKNVNVVVNVDPKEVATELWKIIVKEHPALQQSNGARAYVNELEEIIKPYLQPARRSEPSAYEVANGLDFITRRALNNQPTELDAAEEESLTRTIVAHMMTTLKNIRENETDLSAMTYDNLKSTRRMLPGNDKNNFKRYNDDENIDLLIRIRKASAIDGDKNILDLRVLNNIMDGITQLNNHFRLAVELLKQIAEYHRSETLSDGMLGVPTKKRRPAALLRDSFMDELGNAGRRAFSRDDFDTHDSNIINDDDNDNSNTNINMNTNMNTNRNNYRHFLNRRIPHHFM
ncbi:hypothetical protein PV328_004974 [Microctonus aethiopoides]|uniref:Uncharacterized protein n=1 Tax=Microctonus aethiopoides TaxID=144406 RepID=A0AA39FL00_9HYME|nr:hypothetical protein PV328_004974 [Microctonus aethiopoides]